MLNRRLWARHPTTLFIPRGNNLKGGFMQILRYKNNERKAFTLIEIMAVILLISILYAASRPLFGESARKARETVLKNNLHSVRETIARFYKDNERYPASLSELVEKRYILSLPMDPVSGKNDTWKIINSKPGAADVYDIKSGAVGETIDKVNYQNL